MFSKILIFLLSIRQKNITKDYMCTNFGFVYHLKKEQLNLSNLGESHAPQPQNGYSMSVKNVILYRLLIIVVSNVMESED